MKIIKKNQKLILGIFLIILIVTICILIAMKIGNKSIIEKQSSETQKLTETGEENSYITTKEHLEEVNNAIAKLIEFKREIASAITDMGVATSEDADATIMANNIANILKTKTSGATATESDIAEGKTAWVNGELITGIGTALNDENTESGYKTLGPTGNTTINLKSTPKIILVKPAATDIEENASALYEAYINGKYYGYSGTTTCLMIKNVTDSSFLLCNYMGGAYSFAYRIWY